jgi:Rrf2 family protein
MPERFLLQILRGLVTRGVLHSTRGVEGGYALARSAQEITLLDIIEAVEGPFDAELPEGVQTSPEDAERLRKALGRVVQATKEQMSAIKLSDLAGKLGNPVAS